MIGAGSDLKAFFLLSSFHGTRKYYAGYQRRDAVQQSYLVVASVNHSSDQHGKVFIKMRKLAVTVSGSQSLIAYC